MKKDLPTITEKEAEVCWNKHIKDNTINIDYIEPNYVGNTGIRLGSEDLGHLYYELQNIMDKCKNIIKGNASFVDKMLVKPIHETLVRNVDPKLLEKMHNDQQMGFWLWFNNFALGGEFCKFIKWRHDFPNSNKTSKTNLENWGFFGNNKPKLNVSYFTRIWLRGLMYDHDLTDNPYKYGEIGFSETWRVHLLANENFRNDSQAIKMFFNTIYGPNLEDKDKPDSTGIEERNLFYKITKDLKKLKSNLNLKNNEFFDQLQEILWSAKPEEIDKVSNHVNKMYASFEDIQKNEDIEQEIERRLVKVIHRGWQKEFREEVIKNCDGKCVVTNENHQSACEACHIKDVQYNGPFVEENGLFLRSDIHELFDRGDILIDEDGNLALSNRIPPDSKYHEFLKNKITLPENINKKYINWKYERMKNKY